jgi:serine protease
MDQSYINGGGNQANTAVAGTSFASPMVAGVAALMLAAAPGLSPAQLIARMQSSAATFPSSSSTTKTACQLAATTTDTNGDYSDTSQAVECVCTKATCGAGMLDAAAAVTAASGLFVQIKASASSASPGQHVRLDGSGSTPSSGDTIVSWQWTTDPSTSDQLINADQSIATLVFPAFSTIIATLTITDSGGHTASASVKVAGAFSAASGTGAVDPLTLLMLAVLASGQVLRRRRQSNLCNCTHS